MSVFRREHPTKRLSQLGAACRLGPLADVKFMAKISAPIV